MERPRTLPLVLDQIGQGFEWLTSRNHTAMGYEQGAQRAALLLADGERTIPDIRRALPGAVRDAGLEGDASVVAASLESILATAASVGLLEPADG